MGRNPRTLNNSAMHLTKAEIQAKEESTPIYQSQEFVMPEDLTNEEAKVWEWLNPSCSVRTQPKLLWL